MKPTPLAGREWRGRAATAHLNHADRAPEKGQGARGTSGLRAFRGSSATPGAKGMAHRLDALKKHFGRADRTR